MAHRADHAERGYHGKTDDGGGLLALRIAVEILAHVPQFFFYFLIQSIIAQMFAAHAIKRLHVGSLGQLMEPVAVGEKRRKVSKPA